MLTDDERQAIHSKGRDAEALLDNAGVMDGLRRMSERLTADWRNAPRAATELRDELHAQVAAIDALVSLWKRDVEGAKFLTVQAEKAARR